MKGDFTDVRRWPSKHYTSVRMQQGRVQLDSDWNEAIEIDDYRQRTEGIDVVGKSGAPKGNPGFQIAAVASNQDLTISAGHFYVDGILCELEAGTTYATQPDLPLPEFVDDWGTSAAALNMPDGFYIAYLDVWERHVTALDDEALREPALGGADTTTRTQLIQQVKLLAVSPPAGTPTCETTFPEWTALVTPSPAVGRLAAQAEKSNSTPGPCSVEAQGGYSGLENQLYRVEIHDGGAAGTATFKWSRENGSIAAVVAGQSGDDLTIVPAPGVEFAKGDWIEVIDDGRELRGMPGVLVRVKDIQGAKLILDPTTQDPPSPAIKLSDHIGVTKVRRWEVTSASATSARSAVGSGPTWKALEQRVQVQFEANRSWPSGAWWVVPARVAKGDVIWPLTTSGNPQFQGSLGIQHHYARLALIEKNGDTLTVSPCAKKFPPLTAITASDVSFDDTLCKSGAKTVQEAIDHLCQHEQESCEIVVSPDDEWASTLVQQLEETKSASICFLPGRYALREPLVIREKTSIKITGAGAGSVIVGPEIETVLMFEKCEAVAVRDVAVIAGAVLRQSSEPKPHINGALDFRECLDVLVENVIVQSNLDSERHAAAMTARGSPIRVHGCRVLAGPNQVGLLVVDAPRAIIEDNVITASDSPPDVERMLRSKHRHARVRSSLVSHLAFGEKPAAFGRSSTRKSADVRVRVGGRDVAFHSDLPQATWNDVMRVMPLEGDGGESDIRKHMRTVADAIIAGKGRLDGRAIGGLSGWFKKVTDAVETNVASQGVVIGGKTAPDVQIRGNTISAMRQGIHVGLSTGNTERSTFLSAGRVIISANLVQAISPTPLRGTVHGIFVGNVDSLRIDANRISSMPPDPTSTATTEGIRVYGHLGRHVVMQENHISGFNIGIVFNPIRNYEQWVWRANNNMLENCKKSFDGNVGSLDRSGSQPP